MKKNEVFLFWHFCVTQHRFGNQEMILWTRCSSSTSPWQNWLRQAAQNVSVIMSNLRKILISDFKHKFCPIISVQQLQGTRASVLSVATRPKWGPCSEDHLLVSISFLQHKKVNKEKHYSIQDRSDRLCEAIFIANCDTAAIERVTKNDLIRTILYLQAVEAIFHTFFLVAFRHIFMVF